jgi:hypothetical protein
VPVRRRNKKEIEMERMRIGIRRQEGEEKR